jgi:transcription elongation GreA/GreB family factor
MADNVTPMWDPTNYKRVRQRIRRLWDSGETAISHHARVRMKERRLDITDVQEVIRYGEIVDHSKPGDHWRYVIDGKTVEHTRLRVVVEINGSLMIVTVARR